MISFLVFAASIMVLVGLHEAGHFFMAKAFGVYVKEFAIGFGPKLFAVQGKETRYSLRLIPFGGYVKMAGEDSLEDNDTISHDRVLYSKPPYARALISLAGPSANLLLAFLITLIVIWFMPFPILQVSGVLPNTPAAESLQFADQILAIDGRKAFTLSDIISAIQRSEGAPVAMDILREGIPLTVFIQPEYLADEERFVVGAYFLDAAYTTQLDHVASASLLGANGLLAGDRISAINGQALDSTLGSLLAALEEATEHSTFVISYVRDDVETTIELPVTEQVVGDFFAGGSFSNLGVATRHAGFGEGIVFASGQFVGYIRALAEVIRSVFAGQVNAGEVFQGPIGVAKILGEGIRVSGTYFFTLLAFLSLNFGLINLVPFPALDGSRAVFALYEWIRGKPIPPQREGIIHAIGFLILISLMILITYQDIAKLFR